MPPAEAPGSFLQACPFPASHPAPRPQGTPLLTPLSINQFEVKSSYLFPFLHFFPQRRPRAASLPQALAFTLKAPCLPPFSESTPATCVWEAVRGVLICGGTLRTGRCLKNLKISFKALRGFLFATSRAGRVPGRGWEECGQGRGQVRDLGPLPRGPKLNRCLWRVLKISPS